MWILLRILFGAALLYALGLTKDNAARHPDTGDLANAGYLALCVVIGIANAVVWAPAVGALVADPLTSTFTAGRTIGERRNRTLRLVRWLRAMGCRRLALLFCLLEGIREPRLPAPFLLGFETARPGSWLEKVFAREVWRFDNAGNCLKAWHAMQARGVRLGLHRRPEVNVLILSLEKEAAPAATVLPVPPAPAAPAPARNPRIQLFEGADPVTPPPGASG